MSREVRDFCSFDIFLRLGKEEPSHVSHDDFLCGEIVVRSQRAIGRIDPTKV